jgi:hypothetical protein
MGHIEWDHQTTPIGTKVKPLHGDLPGFAVCTWAADLERRPVAFGQAVPVRSDSHRALGTAVEGIVRAVDEGRL